jgi:hypothetical protein
MTTKTATKKPRKNAAKPRKKRTYEQAPVVVDAGYPCPHCKHKYDHRVRAGGKKQTPGGPRWYMTCGGCGCNFVKMRESA